MTKKKNEVSAVQKVGIGVGLTAAAVTAAGAYFLYGSKQAPKNRKVVKSWALKAKAEVLETLEKAEHITEDEFNALVSGALSTYGKVQSLSKKDVSDFKDEMAGNWKGIVKSVTKKPVKKAVAKKVADKKTPTKKTAKKVVAKKK
ncbi:MAG: D-hexose-6-phosphate mutarotase [Candidatus Azotimanducaceae bacterium]|jgi:D-hexose-6-phosphate mutarotase